MFAASTDDPETNARFAASLELDYPILSDQGRDVARAYGVVEGDGQYAERHTFYIGADGKILHIDRAVKVASAGADIAARLEQLGLPQRGAR